MPGPIADLVALAPRRWQLFLRQCDRHYTIESRRPGVVELFWHDGSGLRRWAPGVNLAVAVAHAVRAHYGDDPGVILEEAR